MFPGSIAEHIVNTAVIVDPVVTADYLTGSISEITPETQTVRAGAAAGHVDRSGLGDSPLRGLLEELQRVAAADRCELPGGHAGVVASRDGRCRQRSDATESDVDVSASPDRVSDAVLRPVGLATEQGREDSCAVHQILVEQDARGGAEGPDRPDHLGWAREPERFVFVCPEINEIQPVASSGVYGTEVVTAQNAAARQAGINKLPSVTAASHVTIKGKAPRPDQLVNINTVMGLAQSLGAGTLATEALLEACIQENTFTNNATGSGSSQGLLQFTAPTAQALKIDPLNITQCVTAFLTKAYSKGMDGYKGAIDYAARHPNVSADQVAQAAQGSAFPKAYGQWASEATTIINASGALLLGNGISTTPTSDIASLERGTPDNPDEDTWTCFQRLATDVNWNIFSDPQPHPGSGGTAFTSLMGPRWLHRNRRCICRCPTAGTIGLRRTRRPANTLTGPMVTGWSRTSRPPRTTPRSKLSR